MIYIILALLVAIVLYMLGFYNKLKTLGVQIGASVQEIGNQLKRQANLIPNLVDSVKGYMTHEKDIFKMLTDARTKVDAAAKSGHPEKIDSAQDAVSKVLSSLQILVESNPQIQASSLVSNLMNELRDTADKLMYSRRTLIDLSAEYNTAIITIPGVWFASLFGFTPQKGFSTPTDGTFIEVSKEETENPKVKLN